MWVAAGLTSGSRFAEAAAAGVGGAPRVTGGCESNSASRTWRQRVSLGAASALLFCCPVWALLLLPSLLLASLLWPPELLTVSQSAEQQPPHPAPHRILRHVLRPWVLSFQPGVGDWRGKVTTWGPHSVMVVVASRQWPSGHVTAPQAVPWGWRDRGQWVAIRALKGQVRKQELMVMEGERTRSLI